jgi:hypothetical protein
MPSSHKAIAASPLARLRMCKPFKIGAYWEVGGVLYVVNDAVSPLNSGIRSICSRFELQV